jgi:hypothetical protein
MADVAGNGGLGRIVVWLALAAQAVAMGVWVGNIQAEVQATREWIEKRDGMESRLAVMESKIARVDQHLDYVDQTVQRFLQRRDAPR